MDEQVRAEIEKIQEEIVAIVNSEEFRSADLDTHLEARNAMYALQRKMYALAGRDTKRERAIENVLTEGHGW